MSFKAATSSAATSSASTSSASTSSASSTLSLWDVLAIIVGIVVGTAIFKTPTLVFQNTAGPWQALGLWLGGGVLSLCGAVCYAELATMMPRTGGDYVFLSRAYGRWLGFLFGWAQLVAILSGSIGAMAYAFGDYAIRGLELPENWSVSLALAAVLVLSLLNVGGLQTGKIAQNLLSLVKIAGLLLLIAAGLWGLASPPAAVLQSTPEAGSISLAMVFVLYAFGGWNDAAFVAAEVEHPQRNLPKALFLGIGGVTLIYLAVNAAILAALGLTAARQSAAPAADAVQQAIGPWAGRGVGLLVAVSALGAIQGMILTGSRVYAALGKDYPRCTWLGRWSPKRQAPINAILSQGGIAIAMILAVGTSWGRDCSTRALTSIALPPIPWERYLGGFEVLVAGTAPIFWSFFFLTGVALVVLRRRVPEAPRPFRVPAYPWPVVLFCGTCLFMLYSSLRYAGWLTLIGLLPMLSGVPLYWVVRDRPQDRSNQNGSDENTSTTPPEDA